MRGLIESGAMFGLILALTLAEAVALTLWHRRTGRGLKPVDIVGQLAAGACLLLAAWLALAGVWWGWVGASLAAAGVAHLFDLRRRWMAA
jgi:hypothetical protein